MSETHNETRIILRKGSETNRSSITPYKGELIYIDGNQIYVGDGDTVGGVLIGFVVGDGLIIDDTTDPSKPVIILNTPGTLDGNSDNLVSEDGHTHSIDTTDARDVDNDYQILLAKALKDHIDIDHAVEEEPEEEPEASSFVITSLKVDNNLTLTEKQRLDITPHIKDIIITKDNQIYVGDGITPGGIKILTEHQDISEFIGTGLTFINNKINSIEPSTISGLSNNNINKHSHAIKCTRNDNNSDNETLLLASALSDHIDKYHKNQETHTILSDHKNQETHTILTDHKNQETHTILTTNGLESTTINNTTIIKLKKPDTLSGLTQNDSNAHTHTHKLLSTDNPENNDHSILLARGLYKHIQDFHQEPEPIIQDHDLLNNINPFEHIDHSKIKIIAKEGLSSTNTDLTKNTIIVLGTPSTLSGSTKNSSFSTTHTHELLSTDSDNSSDPNTLLLACALHKHMQNFHRVKSQSVEINPKEYCELEASHIISVYVVIDEIYINNSDYYYTIKKGNLFKVNNKTDQKLTFYIEYL